jgi:hypothetical protein
LIAQMKADSSRAIAVATMVGRLPFRASDRKRPHSLRLGQDDAETAT